MHLVTGGTGRLGQLVCRQILAHGHHLRILTREPSRAAPLAREGAEIVQGDLTDHRSLMRACDGISHVAACAHGFLARRQGAPRDIDLLGNQALFEAGRRAGVKRVVFVSVASASSGSPLAFFRCKYAAEECLRQSGLPYVILRPAAFMEFWGAVAGMPVLREGRAVVFGRGQTPLSFVSVRDVARVVDVALERDEFVNRSIDLAHPEPLAMNDVVTIFGEVSGRPVSVRHVPVVVLRVLRLMALPFRPDVARQIEAGIAMDTSPQTVAGSGVWAELGLEPTSLRAVATAMARDCR